MEADLAVTRALLHLSGVRGRIASGRLAADVKIHLPDARIVGRGELAGYRAEASPLFAAVAAALQLPELARPEVEKGEVEFTLAGTRLSTSPVRLRGAGFELAGRGVSLLDSRAIDYDLTLALPRAVLARIPVSEVQAAFRDRGDGFATLDSRPRAPPTRRGRTSRPGSRAGRRPRPRERDWGGCSGASARSEANSPRPAFAAPWKWWRKEAW